MTRFVAGRIFDRAGPGTIMNCAYGLLLAGCASLAMAEGPALFTAGGFFLGLGFGIAIPVIQAMINALVPPERRGAANATMMTAFDLGICIGLVATGHVQASLGWQATYGVLFCCVLLSAAVFRLLALPRYLTGVTGREHPEEAGEA